MEVLGKIVDKSLMVRWRKPEGHIYIIQTKTIHLMEENILSNFKQINSNWNLKKWVRQIKLKKNSGVK